ncbi:MAG: PQQ-binding-like beta-propeller repeat protein [Acidobacteriaceae bacterium]|nr:PQQ-binding-like beta-propeller repeat protein [Acidobacteriaceae bacterium]
MYAKSLFVVLSLCLLLWKGTARAPQSASPSEEHDWPAYGGGPDDIRYSDLTQINRSNVAQLAVAWTYNTMDGAGATQTEPIMIEGVLFAVTPKHKIIALDAASGKLQWTFDSGIAGRGPNRGLSYWASGTDKRIFGTVQSYLYALDVHTGEPIKSFGQDGRIDLREGLGRDPAKQSIVMTSPGIVYKDLIIVGDRTPEALPAPPGDIRAYDVRTGAMRWTFHTIPHRGEYGYDTWPKNAWTYSGAANNWSGMALDQKRGIVYVPTGSAASDFYGADRIGDDLFANCLLALDANTGKRIWHFQAVHHDLWDRDFPSPPNLVTVTRQGERVDAVAQTTKHGWVYLFDRANGRPLFPIEEKSYPPSTTPGEVASKTQPLPVLPKPYARQILTGDMLTKRTPEAHQFALEQFRAYRSAGQFVPFSVDKDTVILPGFDGGAEWGGSAVDPETGILYVNANDLPWTGRLIESQGGNTGKQIYLNNCGTCHGDTRAGAPPQIPSLLDINAKLTADQVNALIRQGAGRMPSFPNLSRPEVDAIIYYLFTGEDKELQSGELSSNTPQPKYRFGGYRRFLDNDGYPAVAPPWGTLNAINLNTGDYAWRVPLGEYPELAEKGMKDTGTENYGGPIVTAGGVVFIAATNFDKKFRAFDKETGKLLWETTLPLAGNATPMTYMMGGRQYIVIYASGGYGRRGIESAHSSLAAVEETSGVYVAFALPEHTMHLQ